MCMNALVARQKNAHARTHIQTVAQLRYICQEADRGKWRRVNIAQLKKVGMLIKERLKRARERLGLTQVELSERSGVALRIISKREGESGGGVLVGEGDGGHEAPSFPASMWYSRAPVTLSRFTVSQIVRSTSPSGIKTASAAFFNCAAVKC